MWCYTRRQNEPSYIQLQEPKHQSTQQKKTASSSEKLRTPNRIRTTVWYMVLRGVAQDGWKRWKTLVPAAVR